MTGDHIRTRFDALVSRVRSVDPRAAEPLAEAIQHWQRQGTMMTEHGVGMPTLPAS